MAIKNKNFDGKRTGEISTIAQVLEGLQINEPQLIYEYDIILICDTTIRHLVDVYVPVTAAELKNFRSDLVEVGNLLEIIVKKSSNCEKIIMACLQTLYKLIVSMEKPSAAAGIIFNIYGETLPEAIKILMSSSSNTDFDADIKKVITILCAWLGAYSDFSNLNKCIVEMLNGLAELKKFNLLMELSLSVVERLFIALIIPCIRPNVFPVVIHIMRSAQSLEIFKKLIPRIPKVLPSVESSVHALSAINNDWDNLYLMVDIIFALMSKYPVYDDSYKEIEKALANYTQSNNSHTILDTKSWEPVITINTRDPKTPIGLVNMGNTCYMNSVLQALFMTQKFTREILELRLPSRMIQSVQQLFALLLCSVRPELIPRDILQTRPQTFRYGHQQDSFEYLGYMLDQLHEEEKKCLTDGQPGKCNLPNGYESFKNADDDKYIRDVVIDSANCEPIKTEESDSMSADYNGMDGIECETIEKIDALASQPSPSPSPTDTVQTIVQRIFGGKMSVTYKCLNCSSTSTNVDNFFDLQLSFPHAIDLNAPNKSSYYTTQSLLDTYFSTEKLIDDDKYYCDKCAQLCDGERNINLEEGPSNLILVIKHFKYDRKFHVRRKLLNKVHHNDIITVTTGEDAYGDCIRSTYKLYAVIVHSGMNIDSGHYYTFGSDQYGNWFKFNDNFICRSSLTDIKNLSDLNTPYILFYELIGTEKSNANISSAEIVSNNLAIGESVASAPVSASNFEWPNLNELPSLLQDYVRKDNMAYTNEFRHKNYDDEDIIRYNKYRKSDNDQDPPSSCGGNMIESSNRYIY